MVPRVPHTGRSHGTLVEESTGSMVPWFLKHPYFLYTAVKKTWNLWNLWTHGTCGTYGTFIYLNYFLYKTEIIYSNIVIIEISY